jgi:hypothetical protein
MLKKSLILIALLFIIVGAIFIIFTLKLPHDTYLWRETQNTGHTPIFGIIAIAILGILTALQGNLTQKRLLHYLVAFIGASMMGAAVEIAQLWTPGDADIWDFLRDLAGESAFLGFYMLIDNRMTSLLYKQTGRKLLILVISTIISIGAIYPLAYLAYAYYERDRAFPKITNFEQRWENSFLRPRNITLQRQANPDTRPGAHGQKVACITFMPVTYPTLFIEEPCPNWMGYDTLSFAIFSKQDTVLKLAISIEDSHHNNKYEDRYSLSLKVEPGPNQFNIPLKNIENAPSKRKMKMDSIRAIRLFAHKPANAFSVYIDNFELK